MSSLSYLPRYVPTMHREYQQLNRLFPLQRSTEGGLLAEAEVGAEGSKNFGLWLLTEAKVEGCKILLLYS